MRYVTAALVSGGACGHRIKDGWTARIAAHLWGLTYAHYPFPQDTWLVNGRLPDETQWEPFLGFGADEVQFHQLDLGGLKIVRIDKTEWCGLDLDYVDSIIKAHPEDNVLFYFTESARILLEQLSWIDRDAIISGLRTKYWAARQRHPVVSYFRKNRLNVALHVRRGVDVAPDGRAAGRYTVDSYFQAVVDNIRTALPQYPLDFHIYSEGPAEIFAGYKKPDVFFHFCSWPPLDYRDLLTSFHHMITSQILVTATSEFSYFCAHMNPNVTITLPHLRVVELPSHLRHLKSQPDGSFPAGDLQNLFSGYRLWKQPYLMPIYIETGDYPTPILDAAAQWAIQHDLEPKLVSSPAEISDTKYLILPSPHQRFTAIRDIARLHLQNNFSVITNPQGVVIARSTTGQYSFQLER